MSSDKTILLCYIPWSAFLSHCRRLTTRMIFLQASEYSQIPPALRELYRGYWWSLRPLQEEFITLPTTDMFRSCIIWHLVHRLISFRFWIDPTHFILSSQMPAFSHRITFWHSVPFYPSWRRYSVYWGDLWLLDEHRNFYLAPDEGGMMLSAYEWPFSVTEWFLV